MVTPRGDRPFALHQATPRSIGARSAAPKRRVRGKASTTKPLAARRYGRINCRGLAGVRA